MFLLDICDENVGSMPYFVYPTPLAKQHRRIWVNKSYESTKNVWYSENRAQHSKIVSIFLGDSLLNHTWKGKTGQNILVYLKVFQ